MCVHVRIYVCVCLCVCACVCVCVCARACYSALLCVSVSVSDAPPLWPSKDTVPRASAPRPPHLDVAGAHTGTTGCPSNRPWASPRLLLSASCSQTRPLEAGSAGLPRAGSPELSAPGSPFSRSLPRFSPAPRTPWAGSVGAVGRGFRLGWGHRRPEHQLIWGLFGYCGLQCRAVSPRAWKLERLPPQPGPWSARQTPVDER